MKVCSYGCVGRQCSRRGGVIEAAQRLRIDVERNATALRESSKREQDRKGS